MPAIERRGRVLVATLACAPVDAIDARCSRERQAD